MVSWYLTFALTECYRYTKTFGLSHLNLSFLFVLYCLKDAFSSKEMTSLGQPENFWVSPVLTGFDQLWPVVREGCKQCHRQLDTKGAHQPGQLDTTSALQWTAHHLMREYHLDLCMTAVPHDPQDFRPYHFHKLLGAELNTLDLKLPCKPFQRVSKQSLADSKIVLSWL